MFTFAFLLGLYAYIIFALGLAGVLYPSWIISFSLLYGGFILWGGRSNILGSIFFLKKIFQHFQPKRIGIRNIFGMTSFLIVLFVMQAAVNLMGSLSPELAFDALWYHLTLPKLYLAYNAIVHIPGGLLYYSDMPKLGELFYVAALSFGDEILAKLIHFSFGLFTCLALYKISRKYFNKYISWIAVLLFYSNLVVAWESTTAYIDLFRAFFEVMALWGFINWWETRSTKWLIESAALLGLAMTTKLLALGSLVIFLMLFAFVFLKEKNITGFFLHAGLFSIIAFAVPLPWFAFSFIHTGNPIYPFFTPHYEMSPSFSLFNPLKFLMDIWNIFTRSQDPLSPLYIIMFPLILLTFRYYSKPLKLISSYALLSILMWYLTPQTGGGRFILVYLPALSLVCAGTIHVLLTKQQTYGNVLPRFVVVLLIVISLISIVYRGGANSKYLPVLTGHESKEVFLSKNLNYTYGDYYDTDGFFKKNIASTDKVLLYGYHNLYYVDFPFIHESWVEKGDTFNYIAVQNATLPERFGTWQKVYENKQTRVMLYTDNKRLWHY